MKYLICVIFIFSVKTDNIDNIHSVVEQLEILSKRNLNTKKEENDDMELDILNSSIDSEQAAGYDFAHVENAKEIASQVSEAVNTKLSAYPLIMSLGERVNKFYNYKQRIIEMPKIKDLKEKQRRNKEEYKQTREIMIALVQDNNMKNEIEKFMKNIYDLDLTSEDFIKFFGFEDYFKEIKSRIRTDDVIFDENMRDLDLYTNQMSESVVNFFLSLFQFQKIGQYIKSLASPYRDTVMKKDMMKHEKINVSFELVKGVIHIKDQLTERTSVISDIIDKNYFFRLQIKKQLITFEDRDKADELDIIIQQKEKELQEKLQGQLKEDGSEQNDKEKLAKLGYFFCMLFITFYQIIFQYLKKFFFF